MHDKKKLYLYLFVASVCMAGLFSSCSGGEPEKTEIHNLEPIALVPQGEPVEGNSELVDEPLAESTVAEHSKEEDEEVADVVTASSNPHFKVESSFSGQGGVWVSKLTLRQKDGQKLNEGLINYDLRDCKTEQIFFNGDFSVGASIGAENPKQIRKSTQNWFTQIKPFLLSGSKLTDGQSIKFDKKAWAIKNQKFFKMAKYQDVEPINLCQTLSLMDSEDNIVAQTTSKLTVLSRYIFDNNTYAQEPVKAFPHRADKFARSGGIEYLENSSHLESTNPKSKCVTRNDKIFYVSGKSSRFNVLSGVRYGLDEAYIPLESKGSSLNDAIHTGTGLKFKHHGRLTLGKDCFDHYGSVSVQVGFTDKEVSGLEFQHKGRSPANVIRVRLAPFERF